MGSSLLCAVHDELRARRVLLELQFTDLALPGPLVLWREVPRGRIAATLVEHWIQSTLLMGNISLLEDLAIESGVGPCKIIHVFQRLIKLCLVYLG